jgi:hypothetical protein
MRLRHAREDAREHAIACARYIGIIRGQRARLRVNPALALCHQEGHLAANPGR